VRQTLQLPRRIIDIETPVSGSSQPESQYLPQLVDRWPWEGQNLIEPPPKSRVEELLVVGRGDQKARSTKAIKHLQEGRNYALDLSMLGRIVTSLPERIELVEEKNPRTRARVVENAMEV
jgi:hypothetical protein